MPSGPVGPAGVSGGPRHRCGWKSWRGAAPLSAEAVGV